MDRSITMGSRPVLRTVRKIAFRSNPCFLSKSIEFRGVCGGDVTYVLPDLWIAPTARSARARPPDRRHVTACHVKEVAAKTKPRVLATEFIRLSELAVSMAGGSFRFDARSGGYFP